MKYYEGLFFKKVDKQEDGCWMWTGAQRGSYGGFGQELAHVWSYKNFVGPIADGLQVGHDCHDKDESCLGGRGCPHRLCVNPEHLKLQTPQENNRSGRGNQWSPNYERKLRSQCI